MLNSYVENFTLSYDVRQFATFIILSLFGIIDFFLIDYFLFDYFQVINFKLYS